MAKRFIDTNLFRTEFFRELSKENKLFWVFLLCDCDFAGIWYKEIEVAQVRLGVKLSEEDALREFNRGKTRVYPFDRNKWFIAEFIPFQYGEISPNCKSAARQGVIRRLRECGLPEDGNVQGLLEVNPVKPSQTSAALVECQQQVLFKELAPEEVFKIYNEKLGNVLPKARKLDQKRKSCIQSRIREYGEDAVRQVLDKVEKSDFLTSGNFCSLGWIFLPTNFIKILEGNYDNKFAKHAAENRKDVADRTVVDSLGQLYAADAADYDVFSSGAEDEVR